MNQGLWFGNHMGIKGHGTGSTITRKMLRIVITTAALVAFLAFAQAHKNKCPVALGKYPFDASKVSNFSLLLSVYNINLE